MATERQGERLTIGVLAPLLAGAYMTRVMAGCDEVAQRSGARLIAIQTLDPDSWGTESVVPWSVLQEGVRSDLFGWTPEAAAPRFSLRVSWNRIAGFLVVLNAVEPWYLQALRDAGKPVVVVSDEVEGFPCPVVRADNRTGIIEAVSHLVAHGHRRIAFAGAPAQADIRDRLDAYREALALHDIREDFLYEAADNLEAGGEVAARRMLAAGVPSTAVVAATDYNALGIMKALGEAGLRLPRDQAIVGFDDVEAASSVHPTLSTVHQSFEEIGRSAAHLLLDMLHGRRVAATTHLIPTRFIARASCGCGAAVAVGSQSAGATPRGSPPDRLRSRLEYLLTTGEPATADQASRLDLAVGLLVAALTPGAPEPEDFHREVACALHAISPRWTTVPATIACLREYGREVQESEQPHLDAAAFEMRLNQFVVELSHVMAEAEANGRTVQQLAVDMEHDVTSSLIRGSTGDPRALAWLGYTTAQAGCLGMWSAEGSPGGGESPWLEIAGSFVKKGPTLVLPGRCRVEDFPPAIPLEAIDFHPGDITVVLPTKTTTMDIGLLAIAIPVHTTELRGRDRLYDMGALLGVAVEHELITERLRRSNADLATFSHAMAHDLRNPLATIAMWASVAQTQAGASDGESLLRVVSQIREVAGYADELVTDLLRFAELDRGTVPPEPVDLGDAASRAVTTLESTISEHHAEVELSELPTVLGNFAELELVFQNLIANAVKHGGARKPQVRLLASLRRGTWTVRCRDNGGGIPERLREHVFEPFVRGDHHGIGSGLGLATCRRVVEAHGGRIWIEASSTRGTTIAFTLPALEVPSSIAATPRRAALQPPGAASTSPGRRPKARTGNHGVAAQGLPGTAALG